MDTQTQMTQKKTSELERKANFPQTDAELQKLLSEKESLMKVALKRTVRSSNTSTCQMIQHKCNHFTREKKKVKDMKSKCCSLKKQRPC